ncbi:MAG: response regulator [Candidatus Saccharimonadales bacterium]
MSTVLVVDDQPELRNLFQRVLEHQGYRVVTACNGREAMRVLDSCMPDLLLLDLAMPELDGLSLLRALRGKPQWAKVPAIMLSGLMTHEQVAAARELGVTDQLLKGEFSTRDLRARVARCIAKPAPADPAAA